MYYNIQPLVKLLEETPQLFGELVGRQQFLSRVPHYKENIEVSRWSFSGFQEQKKHQLVITDHSKDQMTIYNTKYMKITYSDWDSYKNKMQI